MKIYSCDACGETIKGLRFVKKVLFITPDGQQTAMSISLGDHCERCAKEETQKLRKERSAK